MKFLFPTKKFLDWLVYMANGRPIIDCGCGEGQVTEELFRRGANVMGLDIRAEIDTQLMVFRVDATTFSFPAGCIVLFARPCHSDWVERTIKQAKHRADVILYVGFDRNLDDDLGEFAYLFKKIGKNVGKEHEYLWFMRRVNNDLSRWCLVKTPYWPAPSWVEDGDTCWVNLAGGYCPKGDKDQVLDRVLVDDYHTLDWTRTGLLDPKSDSGWLDPNGTFYGCASQDHIQFADLILHSSQEELMKKGWCHVWGKRSDPYWSVGMRLTAEQRNWLRLNEYPRVEEEDEDTDFYPTKTALRKIDETSE